MKRIVASHKVKIYLKPGEAVVSRRPVLVATVLGSCVAVTMYSEKIRVGAICHAMLPSSSCKQNDLLCVETALDYMYRKMMAYGAGNDMVVKLFGGAQVLDAVNYSSDKLTVGEQNVARAEEVLRMLGLKVAKANTGGVCGRKLFFSIKNGDVYLRKMGPRSDLIDRELIP